MCVLLRGVVGPDLRRVERTVVDAQLVDRAVDDGAAHAEAGEAGRGEDAGVESETAGVKGFNSDVEKAHAEERGLDWAAVEKLEKQSVSPKDMLAFLKARGLLEQEDKP